MVIAIISGVGIGLGLDGVSGIGPGLVVWLVDSGVLFGGLNDAWKDGGFLAIVLLVVVIVVDGIVIIVCHLVVVAWSSQRESVPAIYTLDSPPLYIAHR